MVQGIDYMFPLQRGFHEYQGHGVIFVAGGMGHHRQNAVETLHRPGSVEGPVHLGKAEPGAPFIVHRPFLHEDRSGAGFDLLIERAFADVEAEPFLRVDRETPAFASWLVFVAPFDACMADGAYDIRHGDRAFRLAGT